MTSERLTVPGEVVMQALLSAVLAQMAVLLLEKLLHHLAEALFNAFQGSGTAAAAAAA